MQSKAIFAAGCFWGVEASFRGLAGVLDVVCGYAGGHIQNPSYAQVCSGASGHAEAVEITFDDTRISYDKLLQHFWQCHDPCQLNRQGVDIGSQYRSAIFTFDEVQRELAKKSKQTAESSGNFRSAIVTEITAFTNFFAAEAYHQRYFEKNQRAACQL